MFDYSFQDEFYFSLHKWKEAVSHSLTSRYLCACSVYFAYSVGMVLTASPELKTEEKNKFYFQFGVVHLVNAFMFMWTWDRKSYFDKVMIPEYLNVAGAILYLWSSTLYGHEYTSDDDNAGYSDQFRLERYLELFASIVEVFAAFGWIYSWHVEYVAMASLAIGPIPSRGWTFDDPDLAANITIAVASLIYFVYNCQVFSDFRDYETNKLYQLGDNFYLINSIFYLLAALRDCGWFWMMPKFGQYQSINMIMRETEMMQETNSHIGNYFAKLDDEEDRPLGKGMEDSGEMDLDSY